MGRPARVAASVFALSLAGLTGCANMVTTAPMNLAPMSSAASISGHVHGGQQPVGQATVQLYVTGTSGYGSGSALRATTNTDDYGNFSFTKSSTASDTVTPTVKNWACPTTGDPQVYIIATGGNTQGPPSVVDDGTNTTTTTYYNPAVALLAAIGDCASVTNTMFVNLNELTTVASTFALAQYINPGSGVGAETIGTSSSTQGTTGLNNAVASIANLVSISNGTPVTSNTYTGAGVSVTATPESAKIITLADTLAACINTKNGSTTVTVTPDATGIPGTPSVTNNVNGACLDLLNSATPPAPAVTSLPSATFVTASDTIQAAYYMATNPTNSGTTYSSCHDGGTTNMSCLFGLATAQSPFQSVLTAQPTDWTVGVTFSSSSNCQNGAAFISGAVKASVDASGNIYFINSPATGANLAEISPTGTPLLCLGNGAKGHGLTIDPAGNVWAGFSGSTGSGAIEELPAGGSSLTAWSTGTASPDALASDGAGNIFYTVDASGGSLAAFTSPGTSTTVTGAVSIATNLGSSAATRNDAYIQADSVGRLWIADYGASKVYDVYPKAAVVTKYAISAANVITLTTANTFAVGNTIILSGFPTSTFLNGVTLTVATATTTVVTANFTHATVATTTESGVATISGTLAYINSAQSAASTAYGIAVGSGAVYSGTTCCSGASNRLLSSFTPVAATPGTATRVNSSQAVGGINGVRALAVDGASNVWIASQNPNFVAGTGIAAVYTISEVTSALAAISPGGSVNTSGCTTAAACATNGGYGKADFNAPLDLEVDPSGNLWVLNSGGSTITEVVGAAVPVATPLSTAAANSQLGTKP